MSYYSERIGQKDEDYGGTITDMMTLPVGTKFYVHNGAWNGEIVEKNKAKCIKIKGQGTIKIDKEDMENRMLSISIVK